MVSNWEESGWAKVQCFPLCKVTAFEAQEAKFGLFWALRASPAAPHTCAEWLLLLNPLSRGINAHVKQKIKWYHCHVACWRELYKSLGPADTVQKVMWLMMFNAFESVLKYLVLITSLEQTTSYWLLASCSLVSDISCESTVTSSYKTRTKMHY